MTKLSVPLTRETAILYRNRPVILTWHPKYIEVRFKGLRVVYTATVEQLVDLAMKNSARQLGQMPVRKP